MSVTYYLKDGDDHWYDFFRKHLQFEMIPVVGFEWFVNSRLAQFDGKIIIIDDGVKTDAGYPNPKVLGIEFTTEQDLLYFKLKFN